LEKTLSKGIHLELESIIEFAKDGIVSKTLVKSGAKEVSMFCMSAGQSLSTHTSSFPATIHIVQGNGKVTLAQIKYEAKPNSWFYMPANLPHAIEATENLVFLLTLFKREDHSDRTFKH
jgi:quercetin dioxygenase-like cupin family protein